MSSTPSFFYRILRACDPVTPKPSGDGAHVKGVLSPQPVYPTPPALSAFVRGIIASMRTEPLIWTPIIGNHSWYRHEPFLHIARLTDGDLTYGIPPRHRTLLNRVTLHNDALPQLTDAEHLALCETMETYLAGPESARQEALRAKCLRERQEQTRAMVAAFEALGRED